VLCDHYHYILNQFRNIQPDTRPYHFNNLCLRYFSNTKVVLRLELGGMAFKKKKKQYGTYLGIIKYPLHLQTIQLLLLHLIALKKPIIKLYYKIWLDM